VMNSRRLIAATESQDRAYYLQGLAER
jgi:hypothetical protein